MNGEISLYLVTDLSYILRGRENASTLGRRAARLLAQWPGSASESDFSRVSGGNQAFQQTHPAAALALRSNMLWPASGRATLAKSSRGIGGDVGPSSETQLSF